MLLPSLFLPLTYQVKLSNKFGKTRSKKSMSSVPNILRSILKLRKVVQAWTGGLKSESSTRKQGSDRWVDVPLTVQQAASWKTLDRSWPMECSGRWNPRQQRMGTPTCREVTKCHWCTNAFCSGYKLKHTQEEVEDLQDHPWATETGQSAKTASSKASQQKPVAGPVAHHQKLEQEKCFGKSHQLRLDGLP